MTETNLSRRDFIARSGLVGAGIAAAQLLPLRFLQAQQIADNSNPLAFYPNRDWEKLYRNQYAYDRSFSWVCAPNDTHNCRITAHVRNGVIVRMGEQYDIGTDRKSTRLNSSHGYISYAVLCFNDTATTEIYTLSLHDALPI